MPRVRIEYGDAGEYATDVLLPDQAPTAWWSAEKRLVAAVLKEAVHCARGEDHWGRPNKVGKRPQDEARRWIDAGGMEPFGFGWVCDVLGLEPEQVRRAARQTRWNKTPVREREETEAA